MMINDHLQASKIPAGFSAIISQFFSFINEIYQGEIWKRSFFLLVIKYFHILSVDTHNIDIKYQIKYQSQIYKEVHSREDKSQIHVNHFHLR